MEFYKGAPDLVKFQELWSQDQTYLDKLKVRTRCPALSWAGKELIAVVSTRPAPPWCLF